MRRALIGQWRAGAIRHLALGFAFGQALDTVDQPVDLVGLLAHDIRQVLDAARQVGEMGFEPGNGVTHAAQDARAGRQGQRPPLAVGRALG